VPQCRTPLEAHCDLTMQPAWAFDRIIRTAASPTNPHLCLSLA